MDVDTEILKRFEDDLRHAERESKLALQRVENLRLIVKGMRGLSESPGVPDAQSSLLSTPAMIRGASATATSDATAVIATPRATYGGRPSIPAVIQDVLGPNDTVLDDIYASVCAHSAYEGGKKPSRGSVTNRLNDMAKRGEIIKVGRTVYKSLPPEGGAGNPDERGLPNPAIQLGAEKSPAEEIAPPQLGHPYGGGSAEAASRF